MTSSAVLTRRDRRRQETLEDIKRVALRQLDTDGLAGISIRAIARDIGTTASAVHYYFPGRQVLLDALIVDGFHDLATALRAGRAAETGGPQERWLAVCRAHREWALAQPARYLLLYGHAGGGSAKGRNPEVRAALGEVIETLFELMRSAVQSRDLDPSRLEQHMSAQLLDQFTEWGAQRSTADGLTKGALAACLIAYAQLHGAITLELANHIPPFVSDRAALFELQIRQGYRALMPL